MKIRGKGLPRYGSYGRGDLMVRLNVRIPTKLNDAQRFLLQELEKEFKKSEQN